MYAIEANGLVKRFGRHPRWTGWTCCPAGHGCSACSGPTAPARRPRCACWPRCCAPDGGRAGSAATTWSRTPRQVRRLIGLTGQYASVDEDLTGTENLVMIGRLLGLRAREAQAPGRRAAGPVRPDRAGRPAGQDLLRRHAPPARPGGQPGRPPAVLFLDEPTTGLDPRKRDEVWDMVRGLVADGVTVLLTTQYLDEADQLADEIVGLRPRPGRRARHAATSSRPTSAARC